MSDACIKIRIMPKGPKTNLKKIEEKAEKIIAINKGRYTKMEREPIAFGITSIIATFLREETLDTDELLEKLKKIPEVSSAEIIDFRRAIG